MKQATRMQPFAAIAPLLACAMATSGCGPWYDDTDVSLVRRPPAPLTASVDAPKSIQISAGAVATATIRSRNTKGQPMRTRVESRDRDIADVIGIAQSDAVAIVGKRVGNTSFDVYADDDRVDAFAVFVLEPPKP